MIELQYKVCKDCGQRHSTLVPHRCFKPEAQKEPPKFKDRPPEEDGPGGGGGQDQSDKPKGGQPEKGEGQGKPQEGDGQSDGGEQQDSEGEGGQGQGEGEGQDQSESEAEGEGEGEGQSQAEEPPPVAVIITVLKYAALIAEARAKKAGMVISVMLTEDGLQVSGAKKDNIAHIKSRTIPWGPLEKRATDDGQAYVQGIVDDLIMDLSPEDYSSEWLPEEEAEAKAKAEGRGQQIDWKKPIEFVTGETAYLWDDEPEMYQKDAWSKKPDDHHVIGVPPGCGNWSESYGTGELQVLMADLPSGCVPRLRGGGENTYQIQVDASGCALDGTQVVRNVG